MAVERHAGIDIFLANAGIEGVLQPITDYPLEVFDQVMAVNVRAVWLGLALHQKSGQYADPSVNKTFLASF